MDDATKYLRGLALCEDLGNKPSIDVGKLRNAADLIDRQAARIAELEGAVREFEPLLIEIEPYRYAHMQEIDRLVEEKRKWAERHNRTCGNSNEMWFYSTEFRRSLEGQLQPLLDAMSTANKAYDRVIKDTAEETEHV